jgi:hypothetical protein
MTDFDVFEELVESLDAAGVAYNGETLYQLCIPIQQHLEEEA